MYDEDIIIIQSGEDDDEPRNAIDVRDHRRSRGNRQAAQPRSRARQAARVYRVPASRRGTRPYPSSRDSPILYSRPGHPAHGPAPAVIGHTYPQPGYPQPGYALPAHPSERRSIPVETLADGTSLVADGVAAILPLPLPPESVGDCDTDLANQNEHRQALAAHTKTGQRIRTGGRILGGLLKLLFTHTR